MALADPQKVTVDGVEVILNRIKSDGYRSEYAAPDEIHKMIVSHQESAKKRTRRMIRLDVRTVAANPLNSVNEFKSLGVYLVIDEPEYGFDDAAIHTIVQGLTSWLTPENVLKVLSNQH